jgi:hypothetical protein
VAHQVRLELEELLVVVAHQEVVVQAEAVELAAQVVVVVHLAHLEVVVHQEQMELPEVVALLVLLELLDMMEVNTKPHQQLHLH